MEKKVTYPACSSGNNFFCIAFLIFKLIKALFGFSLEPNFQIEEKTGVWRLRNPVKWQGVSLSKLINNEEIHYILSFFWLLGPNFNFFGQFGQSLVTLEPLYGVWSPIRLVILKKSTVFCLFFDLLDQNSIFLVILDKVLLHWSIYMAFAHLSGLLYWRNPLGARQKVKIVKNSQK